MDFRFLPNYKYSVLVRHMTQRIFLMYIFLLYHLNAECMNANVTNSHLRHHDVGVKLKCCINKYGSVLIAFQCTIFNRIKSAGPTVFGLRHFPLTIFSVSVFALDLATVVLL